MGIRELVLQRNIEEGIQVGKSKRSREIVTNLLTMTDLAIEKIADIVGVTGSFCGRSESIVISHHLQSQFGNHQ